MTIDFPDAQPGNAPQAQSMQLGTGTFSAVAAGGVQTAGPFNVTGTGWEIYWTITNHTSTTLASDVMLAFQWTDAASGLQLTNDQWVAVAGPAGTAHIVTGNGPTVANSLTLRFTNNADSADAVDIAYTIWQNSRQLAFPDLRSRVLAGSSYVTTSGSFGLEVAFNASVAAIVSGGSWSRLLPLHEGLINVTFSTGSATNDAECQLIAVGTTALANDQILADQFTDTKGLLNGTWAMPRVQCTVKVINHNAAAQTLAGTGAVARRQPG